MHRQPSLFGAGAAEPAPADLAGLLAGPGRIGRMGGTARVTVAVDAAWRVHVLAAELRLRGLAASWEAAAGDRYVVRTAYTVALVPLASAWTDAAGEKRAPQPLHLGGPALRLWVAAAGATDPAGATDGAGATDPEGYLLGLGRRDRACWPEVGAALRAAGLPTELITPGRDREPAYRVLTGSAVSARFADLVGPPPAAAPVGVWPARAQPDPDVG